jgi:hypothetical protein
MIDCLCGYVDEINEKGVILWVNNVGYALNCSANTINDLSQIKDEVKVYTHLSVSESGVLSRSNTGRGASWRGPSARFFSSLRPYQKSGRGSH